MGLPVRFVVIVQFFARTVKKYIFLAKSLDNSSAIWYYD